jgi:hypothetical protein
MSLTKVSFSMIDGDVVNVFDYGAKGDGVTDDTAAVQAALNAGSGKTVYFPEGQYIVSSPLSVKTRTYLLGEQRGQLSGFTTGRQNYFGDYVSGTLIKYTGEWACFELIGDGTANGRVELCQFENLALWGAPLTVTTVFADYKPKHFNSRGWACHYGGGHKWINCWFTSFGYAGIEIGIQGTYRGVTYEAHKSGAGRPTNCKITNCYSSNVFGYGLVAYTEQLDVKGWESDSFTINSNTYSGFQNPVSLDYETGAVYLANSVNCQFQACLFEGDSGRSSGVNLLRYVVDGSSSIPSYNRFVNCLFCGNIYGLQISRIGGVTAIETHVVSCTFDSANNSSGGGSPPIAGCWDNAQQSVISANSFRGNAATQALYAGGTEGTVSGNVFFQCLLPITSNYRNLFVGNTTQQTVGSFALVATSSSEPPRVNRNIFDKAINFNSGAIRAEDYIDDYRTGIQTYSSSDFGGTLNLRYTGSSTIDSTDTLVGTLRVASNVSNRPFMLRIRFAINDASRKYGEIVVYGVSINGGAPVIVNTTTVALQGFAAVADFLTLNLSTVGQVGINFKSSLGGSVGGLYDIEILSFVGSTFVPV